jgi:hypothetical protein
MRPRSILSFAALLLIAGFGLALGRSPPPSAQVVPLPAPTPPAAVPLSPGQIMQSQMHNRPPGIPGFLDPATGRFSPAERSGPKTSASVPPTKFSLTFKWHFNPALKPYNTVNCSISVDTFDESAAQEYGSGADISFSVGNPPSNFTLYAPYPVDELGLAGWEASAIVDCNAEDDSGQEHIGAWTVQDSVAPELFVSLI